MMTVMVRHRLIAFVGFLLVVAIAFSSLPNTVQAQPDELCFDETTFCISGTIREYWEQNGGLPVFGFPKSVQYEELIEGQPYQVQWFERNRLEIHPENKPPYNVLLGRLGVDELEKAKQQGEWAGVDPEGPLADCVYFEQTGFNICYQEILDMYRSNGLETDGQYGFSIADNMALFGLPLTPLISEDIDGTLYQVQYFERARFEWHPDENQVLLGLLGNNLLDRGIINLPHKPFVVANNALSIELPVHWPRMYEAEGNGNHLIVSMSPDYLSWIVLHILNMSGMTDDQKVELIKNELVERFSSKNNLQVDDPVEQPDGSIGIPFTYNEPSENNTEMRGMSFYQENGTYLTIMTVYTYAGEFDTFKDTYNNIINTYQINPDGLG
jgi:hypothetical protein